MASKIRNIPLKKYRKFLKSVGCNKIRTNGGHEMWSRSDINRSLTLQSHIDPVPEFIVKQHLRYLGMTKDECVYHLSQL